MAKFTIVRVLPGTAPQTAWAMLKGELVTAVSVEVVPNEAGGGFDLHLWLAERKDGSNGAGADTAKQY